MVSLASLTEAGLDDIVSLIFIKRVRSLPPELYSHIHDLTFCVASFEGYVCHVDEKYKPPSILQVNRHWRSVLSTAFYNDTIFTFTDDKTLPDNLSLLGKFFKTLPTMAAILSKPEVRILSRSTKVGPHLVEGKLRTFFYAITYNLYSDKRDWIAKAELVSRVITACPIIAYSSGMRNVRFHIETQEGEELVFESELRVEHSVALIVDADSGLGRDLDGVP